MNAFRKDNLKFVERTVGRHDFCDPTEWAAGLDKLADLDETQIDSVFSRLPLGVSRRQAHRDRALYHTVMAEIVSD